MVTMENGIHSACNNSSNICRFCFVTTFIPYNTSISILGSVLSGILEAICVGSSELCNTSGSFCVRQRVAQKAVVAVEKAIQVIWSVPDRQDAIDYIQRSMLEASKLPQYIFICRLSRRQCADDMIATTFRPYEPRATG